MVDTNLVSDAITNWLATFGDQTFTLTDTESFEVMKREKLTRAFAFDQHFEIAGFELLAER